MGCLPDTAHCKLLSGRLHEVCGSVPSDGAYCFRPEPPTCVPGRDSQLSEL